MQGFLHSKCLVFSESSEKAGQSVSSSRPLDKSCNDSESYPTAESTKVMSAPVQAVFYHRHPSSVHVTLIHVCSTSEGQAEAGFVPYPLLRVGMKESRPLVVDND